MRAHRIGVTCLLLAGAACAQQLRTLYQQVVEPPLAASAAIENVEFEWQGLHFTLQRGQMALAAPVSGRVLAAVFAGTGSLRTSPANDIERQQMILLRGKPALDEAFTAAEFRFADGDAFVKALGNQVHFHALDDPTPFRGVVSERARYVRVWGLDEAARLLASLSAPLDSPLAGSLFRAELKGSSGWFEAAWDVMEPAPLRVHAAAQRAVLNPPNALTRLGSFTPTTFDAAAADIQEANIPGLGDITLTGFDNVWTQSAPAEATPPTAPWSIDSYTVKLSISSLVATANQVGAVARFPVHVHAPGAGLLFHLDSGLVVSSATLDGAAAEALQPADPGPVATPSYTGNWLYLQAPHALEAAETAEIELRYRGSHFIRRSGPGDYVVTAPGWYPRPYWGEPAPRANFDLVFTTAIGDRVIATGVPLRNDVGETTRVTEWKTPQPVPAAGFAYGDFTFTDPPAALALAPEYQARMAVTTRTEDLLEAVNNKNMLANRGLPMGILDPKAHAAHVLEESASALKFLTLLLGPLPGGAPMLANRAAVDTDANPMTNFDPELDAESAMLDGPVVANLAQITSLAFLDEMQMHVLLIGAQGTAGATGVTPGGGVNQVRALTETLGAHELAHEWFGNLITPAGPGDVWLSEGLAGACALLYEESRWGEDNAMATLKQWSRELEQADLYGRVPAQLGPVTLGTRLASSVDPAGYRAAMYDKAPYVIYMLRELMMDSTRKDEDADFIALLHDFAAAYGGKSVSTAEFKAMVEKHMTPAMDLDGNHRMDWFFDQYVYDDGIPEVAFKSQVKNASGKYRVTLIVDNPGGWRGLLPVYLIESDKHYVRALVHVTQPHQEVEMVVPFSPTRIEANHFQDMLAQVKQTLPPEGVRTARGSRAGGATPVPRGASIAPMPPAAPPGRIH